MAERPRLLLVEDDPIMGESLMDRFDLEGLAADWAQSGAAARRKLAETEYAFVISDIRLPDMSGEVLFQDVARARDVLPKWLFITGYGTIDQAVALLKQGAVDYITKPFDLDALIDKLRPTLDAVAPEPPSVEPILGVSPSMRRIETQLPRLAARARTLLITGESGVGKELVARLFHRLGPRGEAAPFVAVNCGALPEGLLEAELFGHEKGAFTGAVRARRGVFEQADRGTLFLDEIGDMPLTMQVRLLRVLQERRVTRLGAERPVAVDIGLITATHQDLKKLVAQGRFREDLYYRINVIQLHIPPLRQRREDIFWLAHRFLAEAAPEKRLSAEGEQTLIAHDWPGNVRELKHALERAAILCAAPTIGPTALFEAEPETEAPSPATLADFVNQAERRYIARTLESCEKHLGRTAAALGISRKNLWEKMRKLGLSANGDSASGD